ncbi:hypothetical protein CYY_007900 [Polysphondylium violaceum]|uniref:Expansin-like EG45 domain-containing protein n=1 Tax=Polysphondylium violaceum TaxID=133409 RepID=A0A8J4UQJ9_9MYCE|nr:hypothetical protein CYY_007900 [Polysphondylium violaceum]
MFFIKCLLIAAALLSVAKAGNPLTTCMAGRAQGTEPLTQSGSCEYGAYNSPTGPGTFTATLNEYFYSSGVKCGDCFEITGPLGVTTVRAVNFCSKNTCPSEKPLFMLTPDAFSQISSEALSVVYDAGFRKVSCDATGPLKGQLTNDTSKYYVKVLLFNNNVGIQTVSIKGQGMEVAEPMVRQNSAQFVWSKPGAEMKFPANVSVTSQYGSTVQMTIEAFDQEILTFNDNFEIPRNVVKGAPEKCILSQSPATIYSDSLAEGWDYWSSRSYSDLNTTDTTVFSTGKASLSVLLMGNSSYLSLTRSGDFQTEYFTGIKFSVRSDKVWSGLRVYIRPDSFWSPSTNITTEWSTHTVSFDKIKHNSVEKTITFGNTQDMEVKMYLDDVSFVVSTKPVTTGYSSTENSKELATSTTAGATSTHSATTGITASASTAGSTTTGTITAGNPDENNSHHSSSSFLKAPSTLMVALFAMMLFLF